MIKINTLLESLKTKTPRQLCPGVFDLYPTSPVPVIVWRVPRSLYFAGPKSNDHQMWWFYGVKDVESFTVLLETKSLHDISGTCAQMMANVQLGRWIDVFCYKRFCQWGNCSDSQPKAEGTHSGNLMEQPKHYFSAYMTSLIKWSCWGWGFFVFVSSLTKLNTALWRMFFLVCNMFQHQLCNSKYTSSNIDTSQNTAINMFDKWKKTNTFQT